ncbi:amino acid ABC transporter substrate-binding protein, partial [Vibrio vulnificus]
MNKLLFVVTTLLLSFLSHAATITAAQDPWAPFVQQNNANPGISVEIVIEAFKTQGH